MRRRGPKEAFTILEIVVVLLVISILGLMLLESFKSFEARAERTRCMGNLRGLFVGLAAYTQDQNHWPQCPFELGQLQYDKWWIKEMSRYQIGRQSWECPSYLRLQREGKADKEDKLLHYTPTPFDDGARTPYKWPNQPWVAEMGDFHGDGNLILFPDGSIKGFNQVVGGQP